ncbi:O-methyltransferase [Mycobacteroides abscessus]|uniref:O-methyltransferase n=1 Tax=Mycobacteroides abscessus TaxID=36809 RepID=UPI002106E418|nr:class I SAM-dependent methyltransferase [Mycobacteroides abscessus]
MSRLSYYLSVLKAAAHRGETDDANKEALVAQITSQTQSGDIDAIIDVIDDFGKRTSFLMNIGDEKGILLEDAIRRAQPRQILELGAFCGYSGLRIARAMPVEARLHSIELNPFNAGIATRIWQHAGVHDRVSAVLGSIEDGQTIERLHTEFGFTPGSVDFLFIDHAHSRYLPDLLLILQAGLLHPGTVVFADNVKIPGAPEYLAYMREHEGGQWSTITYKTHLEYQLFVPDLVLESTYRGQTS